MILRDPVIGMMRRSAFRVALVLGGLGLLLLPGRAPGRLPQAVPPGTITEPDRQTPVEIKPGAKPGGESRPVNVKRPASDPGGPLTAGVVARGPAASQPIVREVSDYADFVGHVEAARTVEVRARVGGILVEVPRLAGRVVEPGERLFEIDARPYRTEMDRAEAEVAQAEARLKRRSSALEQAEMLHAKGTGSRDEVVRLELERDEATASLKAARATRELARLNLESTRIMATIRGRVGSLQHSLGNRVVAGETVLATITSIDPMAVAFNIDEHTALTLLRERREDGSGAGLGPGRPVLIGLADEVDFPRRGQVESVNTQFDPETGSLHCRAVAPNSDGLLMPGLFARVRLATSAPRSALLVSGGATRKDGRGDHVFIVNDRGVVERRSVKLGGIHDRLREVKAGLREGDWVIVAGFDTAKAGTAVKPVKVAMPGSALVSP